VAKRTPRRLVALSCTAIAAIYAAGYAATGGADASLGVTPSPALLAAAPTPTGPVLAPTATTGPTIGSPARIAASPNVPTPLPSASATPTGAYRDGTYTGSGDSRRGGFSVAVTIHGGRIADVKITDAWTQYSPSRVAALPAQVIARQAAQVDRVTGATYSVQAFQQAVQQALAQAVGPSGAPPATLAGSPPPGGPALAVPRQPVQPLPRQRPRGGRGSRD
jgi:uncharacterized protein with FMN-binding domain